MRQGAARLGKGVTIADDSPSRHLASNMCASAWRSSQALRNCADSASSACLAPDSVSGSAEIRRSSKADRIVRLLIKSARQ
jgi:hypothetical protein